MKVHPYLFSKLFCQPLMVTEPVRFSLESALLQRMGLDHGGVLSAPPIAPLLQERSEDREWGERGIPMEDYLAFRRDLKATQEVIRIENVLQTFSNVAVVKMHGVIDKHLSQFEMDCYGGYDLADFDTALAICAQSTRIERVVLDINSPGGSVLGVPESAARVAALAQTKEVHAYFNGQACSAAYYIGSQADHIASPPSAISGSIGVYMTLLDSRRNAEMQGYKIELIRAGKFKAMGSPFRELTDEERSMLQARADDLHKDFRTAVRSGRRRTTESGGHQTVSDGVMEGQWFDGKGALEARLVDELTNASLDEYVAALM